MDSKTKSEIRRRFLRVDASNVADVLDQLKYPHQGLHPDFSQVRSSQARLAGWAYTIRGQMSPYEGAGDVAKISACQGIGSDEVSVWAGDGAGICYFGELIALGMRERGCVGAIVDGGVRDVRWLREHDIPVFARYRTAVQSIGRWRVTGCREPVYLRGATTSFVCVTPGDFVLADDDGAIVVPSAVVTEVLEQAEKLTEKETVIRAELENGLSLAKALEKFGHV